MHYGTTLGIPNDPHKKLNCDNKESEKTMEMIYNVLPCNGMDKSAGCVAREAAMQLEEKGSRIVCPVLCSTSSQRYANLEYPLLVIDGCTMRCASKLAAKKHFTVAKRLNIADEARAQGISLPSGLHLGETEIAFAHALIEKL